MMPCTANFIFLQALLFFCVNLICLQVDASGNETDRIALLKFKEGISSDNGILHSWNDSVHHCSWFGVTCNRRHGRVSHLVLSGQKLSGSITPYIGNLSFLRNVDLENNSLSGEIPNEVGKLFRLQIMTLNNNTLEGGVPANLSQCLQLSIVDFSYNNLVGKIPAELGSLPMLRVIAFTQNHLSGEIPPSLANITSLRVVAFGDNKLAGNVPDEISHLSGLVFFSISTNNISGMFPSSIFNISSLKVLTVTQNRLRGTIPDTIGLTLPNLELFSIGANKFTGSIPSSLSNASNLQRIGVGDNRLVGQVPTSLGNLQNLWWISIFGNKLGSNSSKDLEFLTSLTNCSNMQVMDMVSNNFGGVLPDSIGNFSTNLRVVYLGINHITGTVPATLEKLVNLEVLSLPDNQLTGVIPSYLGKFQRLQVLLLNGNRFSGQIPPSIGNLTQLFALFLNGNKLDGSIPESISTCQNLQLLELSQNNLHGTIPRGVLGLSSLTLLLNFSQNLLTGELPSEVGNLRNLLAIDFSENKLSGQIPESLGYCISLEQIYMSGNSFQGSIPSSLVSLKVLQNLDISRNNLSGQIPKGFEKISFVYLNLSFNDLQGAVPLGGVFRNASAVSLTGNSKLCGGVPELDLPKCPTGGVKKHRKHTVSKVAIIVAFTVLFVVLIAAFLLVFWKMRSKTKTESVALVTDEKIISYRDLHQGTNGFSPINLIGSGSFGSVYKGILDGYERPVAVKVLNLEQKGASKSFKAECKTLRNVRHRNLVKILTYCSSMDYKRNEFKALVFELMENGSLDKWLHTNADCETQSKTLNFLQRLNIAIDVASALHYLHHLCETPTIHCDLKPSNILLDNDMVGHVSDFGLARLFSKVKDLSQPQTSTIGLKGTVGYAAPEYGTGAVASTYGDVYSYGILLLEMFSGKKPTDEMFKDGLNLHDYVQSSLPNQVLQIADPVLVSGESGATEAEFEVNYMKVGEQEEDRESYKNLRDKSADFPSCLLSVFEIGVKCSAESTKERMNMRDVTRQLHTIKEAYFGD